MLNAGPNVPPTTGVPVALFLDPDIDLYAVGVFGALTAYSTFDASELVGALGSSPSLKSLEELTGLSRKTVQKRLCQLEDAGWIRSRKRKGSSTIYALILNPPHARNLLPRLEELRREDREMVKHQMGWA